MSSYSAPIDIARAALPLIGGEIIDSLDDQSAEANVFNATYGGVVESELCKHSWSFAVKRSTLTYQGETGDKPLYAYALPSDVLAPRKVLFGLGEWREYEIRGDQLLCDVQDSDDIDLIYNYRADEVEWPSDFAHGIVNRMAAILARSLLERFALARDLDATADKLLQNASVRDRRSNGKVEFNRDPGLVRAWRNRAVS
ncbi:MAG: hypothetical protein VX529_08105 [Pseudomonadota bacterium]|nr:hypothetical protein [Pseudomonadota bacterium]